MPTVASARLPAAPQAFYPTVWPAARAGRAAHGKARGGVLIRGSLICPAKELHNFAVCAVGRLQLERRGEDR
eukprot:scaffold134679_cov27-Tisochrysis_lutea.AAC.3